MIKVAIDGNICLYQFKFSYKRPNSEVYGIIYRTLNILKKNILPIYCFDGGRHPLKSRRPKKFVKPSTTKATKALKGMGVPVIISPYDAEAQCAYLNRIGFVDFFSSNDIDDTFAFGGKEFLGDPEYTIITGKKQFVKLSFKNWLEKNGLPTHWAREDYVDFLLLLGTDYNKKLLPRGRGKAAAIKIVEKNETPKFLNREAKRAREYILYPEVKKDIKKLKFRKNLATFTEILKYFNVPRERKKRLIKKYLSVNLTKTLFE